ncbi:MAG: DNA topoisomerase 4 subunit A, partial [Clostridia bacterium]|nr:DNA topoisomerase 4 subunit A [Clostridia bacterium]
RDGLKPVHRRSLYTLFEDNLTADTPFKKAATCVGDVLGKYHPHGDTSVYDAMVRLAQDFSMRYMLVEGHGNFGSVDGDPPAAYRYTEARLSKISNHMLEDIEKDTVDWSPNFDESCKEPRALPARFPNLIVNGSQGIAVGMTTSIPPHNLTEAINACICVLENPEATLEDMMEHIKGPDFPTRGIIMGRSGIKAAYATGRGKVVVRARTEFEEYGRDNRTRIIVTELPYMVKKRALIKKIADQVREKRLEGISDLRDESDRNGMRIVIELKRDANAQVVLNKLFSQTEMQSSFGIIMRALVDDQKQPKILTLKEYFDEYIAFQKQVLSRRTKFLLNKALERAHLLEGLIIAHDNIDEVIQIIRTSYDDAKQKLMDRFSLDDVQAQAILDMRLKALQGLDHEKLEAEYKELEEKIAYYRSLLSDENMLRGLLKDELIAIRDKYGDERRTEIVDVSGEVDIEDLIPEEECVFTLTEMGYIKRTPATEYRQQGRNGRGSRGVTTREEDNVKTLFTCSTHDFIMCFTNQGRAFRIKGYEIPEGSKNAKGTNVVNVLQINQGERITAMI